MVAESNPEENEKQPIVLSLSSELACSGACYVVMYVQVCL